MTKYYDLALEPTDAAAYKFRGEAKTALGKHDEAVADYNKAIALDPTTA